MNRLRQAWIGGAAAVLGLVLAAPGVADAQQGGWVPPPAVTTVAPLVITAPPPRLRGPELDRALEDFVQERALPTRVDRVARWRMPICPETIGLGDDLDAQITQRILQVGAAIGAPPREKGTCLANIEVVVTPVPQMLMDRVKNRLWLFLGYHYAADTNRIARMTRPIQSWYVTGTRGYANTAVAAGTVAEPPVGAGQLAIDDPLNRAPAGSSDGHFDTSLSSEFGNVLIVIDQSKVAGASTQAIADYAAMLAFAQPRTLDACGPLPSILDLYAQNCPTPRSPEGLTASDLAYLRALYATETRLPIRVARSDLTDLMHRALAPR